MTKKLLFWSLFTLSFNSSAQTPLWGVGSGIGEAEAEFQNGFVNATTATYSVTSWTAQTVSDGSGNPGAAYWTRSTNGLTQGAYATGLPVISSPTALNGAALFDSDYLDNGGTQGAFGAGTSPSPQIGSLVSPRIDLNGNTNEALEVSFYCQYREYSIATLGVALSTDDGLTWTEDDVQNYLPAGVNVFTEGWVNIVFPTVTQGVSNLANCRLRFRFDGDYYFAMIDDITISNQCLPTSSTLTVSACEEYTSPSGNFVWSSSGTYTDVLVNAAGCDSTITVDLTIASVTDLTTSLNGITITANNGNATYQWLDCDNNFAQINGATNSMFTPTSNGNYAVELTENGCVDTSACVMVATLGSMGLNAGFIHGLYPNPTSGLFTIDMGSVKAEFEVRIADQSGRLIQSSVFRNTQFADLEIKGQAGVYFVTVASEDERAVMILTKE
jgi:hypothetical protein